MSVPRDGAPTNLPANVLAMRHQVHERGLKPVLVLRRRAACECRLGAVYRVDDGVLLIGTRRSLVAMTVNKARARLQDVYLDVDALPDVAVGEVSCKHGSPRLRRTELLAAMKSARGHRATFLLD